MKTPLNSSREVGTGSLSGGQKGCFIIGIGKMPKIRLQIRKSKIPETRYQILALHKALHFLLQFGLWLDAERGIEHLSQGMDFDGTFARVFE